jgi:Nif11 domain
MKVQANAAHFFSDVEREEDRQLRLKALEDPTLFMRLAREQGYDLSADCIEDEIAQLSTEMMASIWNPGIGARRHLTRR